MWWVYHKPILDENGEIYLLKLFEEQATGKETKEENIVLEEPPINAGPSAIQQSNQEPMTILFIKSELRLVIDLQACIKA